MYRKFALETCKSVCSRFYANFSKISKRQSHYEVLGLSANCSNKDIKDAYIELSKKYHPDVNASESSQKNFVRVVEAYNTLSKPNARQLYDQQLRNTAMYNAHSRQNPSHYDSRGYSSGYAYDDPSFWTNRSKYYYGRYRQSSYYGIPGVERVSNGVIALFCVIFASIGVTIQCLAIKHSMTLRRDRLKKESEENMELLTKLEESAVTNGNEYQIQILEERLKKNPYYRHPVPDD